MTTEQTIIPTPSQRLLENVGYRRFKEKNTSIHGKTPSRKLGSRSLKHKYAITLLKWGGVEKKRYGSSVGSHPHLPH